MMANWLSETMRPRIRAGLISAMYIGLVIEAARRECREETGIEPELDSLPTTTLYAYLSELSFNHR